ncbi:hypothetical protein IXO621_16300, partial [Xanthomonas oryzae pv. oryzae]
CAPPLWGLTRMACRCGMEDEKRTAKAKQEHSNNNNRLTARPIAGMKPTSSTSKSPAKPKSQIPTPQSRPPPLWHPTCISTSHES